MDPKVMTTIAGEIARTLQAEGNVRTVFGEPVMLDSHKVIPVSAVLIDIGGGGAYSTPPASGEEGLVNRVKRMIPAGVGGGFALDVRVVPVGYLREDDGRVEFCPIALPAEILASKKR
jgi:uncharacterized spore protein YtfJ